MQERRYRPGDVLDDYCPRERRITDHAIVAMIDDEVRRTRCNVCDAEHEYKEAKVPAPRRKTQPPALFNQVLDGLNGSSPRPQPVPSLEPADEPAAAALVDSEGLRPEEPAEPAELSEPVRTQPVEPLEPAEPLEPSDGEPAFRRSLIRATFPRPDGQAPPARNIPEFTIQSLNNRGRNGQRHGQNKFRGRRRAAGGNLDHIGPMRFRDHGHGQNQGGGQGQGQGGGGRRRRRGGKKNG
ncbi:MAG TPA: hypothetical protein VFP85_11195 [Vicinamibacterales bacterium]|nr:hypothetical protein [Vicinamibacterales bacterium]